jgi:hypothetical protein
MAAYMTRQQMRQAKQLLPTGMIKATKGRYG